MIYNKFNFECIKTPSDMNAAYPKTSLSTGNECNLEFLSKEVEGKRNLTKPCKNKK
jgi:hypothetical protein